MAGPSHHRATCGCNVEEHADCQEQRTAVAAAQRAAHTLFVSFAEAGEGAGISQRDFGYGQRTAC
jgi:hypothetical protein